MVEHLRLAADLDGDGEQETIVLSTSGTAEFQRYWVRVRDAAFSEEFFALDGLPKLKIIRINTSEKLSQLLVSTSGPVGCGYVILAFRQSKISRLLKHGNECEEPQIRSNSVGTFNWEGFWYRRDYYTLDSLGTKLIAINQAVYPVTLLSDKTSVTAAIGIASQSITLEPADCKVTTISQGERVIVNRYDRLNKLYFLQGKGDKCGWIPESDLPHMVDGLPWAG